MKKIILILFVLCLMGCGNDAPEPASDDCKMYKDFYEEMATGK